MTAPFDDARERCLLFKEINDEDKPPRCYAGLHDMGHQEVEVVELIEVTNRIYASILSRYLQL